MPDEAHHDAPRGDAVVSLRHVSKWHGEVIAVNDVSVDIPHGVTGLLGPNGAGKSTMLRMIVGLSRPSSGAVRVLGEDPWGNARILAKTGYDPEAPAPWRDMTARECAVRAARYSGLDKGAANRVAMDALERVGLREHADRRIAAFSQGMHQRVKFALAIQHDPDVLILDEPLLGTDPLARRDLLALMQKVAAEGKSVLISTHVLADVEALTSRIVVLDHGRLLAHGDVQRIRDLLDKHPRQVRIATTRPREVGAALWGWDSVESAEVQPGALVVRTRKPMEFYAQLQALLAKGDLPFASVTSPDDHVETVFRYLVG